jgi:hypothetical protein
MLEASVTYTRPNTAKDFFAFQTTDLALLKAHTAYRNEMSQATGFLGFSYFVSEDRLQLRLQVLWESESNPAEFAKVSKHRAEFVRLSRIYNKANSVDVQISKAQTFDPEYLKVKKLASRLTVKEAQDRLVDFLSQQK